VGVQCPVSAVCEFEKEARKKNNLMYVDRRGPFINLNQLEPRSSYNECLVTLYIVPSLALIGLVTSVWHVKTNSNILYIPSTALNALYSATACTC
jgi:hypothetical protein